MLHHNVLACCGLRIDHVLTIFHALKLQDADHFRRADATIASQATGAMSWDSSAHEANPKQSYVELLNSIRMCLLRSTRRSLSSAAATLLACLDLHELDVGTNTLLQIRSSVHHVMACYRKGAFG